MGSMDGMNHQPVGKPKPVVEPGEFVFAAMHLDHGHIGGMCNALIEAGATLKFVYDSNEQRGRAFAKKYPGAIWAQSEEIILQDPEIQMVASAAVTSKRCEVGLRCMDAGKDYFTDKAPFTTLEQLEAAKQKVRETGKKYMVYYSERLHVESAVYAGNLIRNGAIGIVVNVLGLGPHRLNAGSRPAWFFEKESYGGILCDIGSHQIEQYLYYADVKDAKISYSHIANYNNHEYPELEDFGEAMLVGDNGTTNYFRVDWFTPDGLSTWGDGRTIILGTEGYIELRKFVDIASGDNVGDKLYLVDHEGEHVIECHNTVGYPFFGELILDCINRTENAMTQEHAFKAAELCLQCEIKAEKIYGLDQKTIQ